MLSIIPIKLTAAVGGFFCSDGGIVAVMWEYNGEIGAVGGGGDMRLGFTGYKVIENQKKTWGGAE